MKKFLKKIFYFSLLFIILILIVLVAGSYLVSKRNFKNYETESNTLVFGKDKHYDLMFSGISHARNFSRHKNHLKIESILNQSIINIGQGIGTCGANEQYFYLKYFYSKNNSVDRIIYVLSPPMMYSNDLPIASNTFNKEIFDFDFLYQYILFESENKNQRILHYLLSKLNPNWIFHFPFSEDDEPDFLSEIDPKEVELGFMKANGKTLDQERFIKSSQIIEEEIKFALEHEIELTLIIPPALFGHWPGHENVDTFAKNMQKKYQISYLDLSESILEPEFYYDHHHLNTKGVAFFAKNYLKEMLTK